MGKDVKFIGLHFVCGMMITAMQAMAADSAPRPGPDTRNTARMMAQIEVAIERKDVKLYCEATVSNTEYQGTAALACLERAELKKGKLEDCTLRKIQDEVKKEQSQCLAMTPEQLAKKTSNFAAGRDKWIASVKKLEGVDAAKLIQEERSIVH